jgi:hypothetical protein
VENVMNSAQHAIPTLGMVYRKIVIHSSAALAGILLFSGCAPRDAAAPKAATTFEVSAEPETRQPSTPGAVGASATTHDAEETGTSRPWSAIVGWTHAWDAGDSVAYDDDGAAWSIPAAKRVDSIPDRGTNNVPLKRDSGTWGQIMKLPRVPGPKIVASSQRFNGRPALFTDPVGPGGFGTVYSALATAADPRDESQWFNPPAGYDTPYWGAVLCRPANGLLQNFGAWDAYNGTIGTTVTLGKAPGPADRPGRWGMTTSLMKGDPWPATKIAGSDDETVLVIAKVDGADSFMEINWRDATGRLQTDRTVCTLANYTAKEIFLGYVHSSYLCAAGFKTGSPAEAEIDALRAWAASWLAPAGPLPVEP